MLKHLDSEIRSRRIRERKRHWQSKVAAAGGNPRKMTTETNSRTEQHLEYRYSNTLPVRSEEEHSKIERPWHSKVADAGGNPTENQ